MTYDPNPRADKAPKVDATEADLQSIRIHATAALVGTGITTVGWIASQLLGAASLGTTDATTAAFQASGALLLWIVTGAAGYVTLCLWMMRMKRDTEMRGLDAPATWKIWFSWIIPVYAFWGPYKALTEIGGVVFKRTGWAPVAWWIGWIISLGTSRATGTMTLSEGAMSAIAWGVSAWMLVSYLGLASLITAISADAAEPYRASPGTASDAFVAQPVAYDAADPYAMFRNPSK